MKMEVKNPPPASWSGPINRVFYLLYLVEPELVGRRQNDPDADCRVYVSLSVFTHDAWTGTFFYLVSFAVLGNR